MSEEESNNYYWSRPEGSQMGAWASNQSQKIACREALEKQLKDVEDRFKNKGDKDKEKIPRPPHWGGFRLVPDRIEFWKGRQCRLHDRIVYKAVNDTWEKDRLQP